MKETLKAVLPEVEREARTFLQKLGALRERYDNEPNAKGRKRISRS